MLAPWHKKESKMAKVKGEEGARPGQLHLQPHRCPHGPHGCLEEGAREHQGANTSLFTCRTIPGYTGFIPRAQNHFAKTYTQICKQAGQEFARQLARDAGRGQGHQVTASPQDVKLNFELPTAEEKPQLPAAGKASSRGVPAGAFKPHGAPAAAEEDDGPPRHFIPGFTGFVPRARYLIGAGYPTLTRRAWAEFRQMLRKQRHEIPPEMGAQTQSDSRVLPPLVKTYPTDKGLLPHYQGYVPGYKFRFGRTYGHLTYDALGRSLPEKLVPDRLP
uniref:Uncharacterized protein n=1 Tax=Sphaerodactylus townsendi TaxID=933632 RepID=A0ACB8EPK6_9SAUR